MTGALSLSVATTTGCYIIYKKLPDKVKEKIKQWDLATEVATILAAYIVLGGTLTALMASALVGLQTSALLYISNNPEQFLYLEDIKEYFLSTWTDLQSWLENMGNSYQKQRTPPVISAT